MKLKRTVLLATVVVTLGLLLVCVSVSTADAATIVRDPLDSSNAIRILGLEFDGTVYNVDFFNKPGSDPDIYGFEPVFDFTAENALKAVSTVCLTLSAAGDIETTANRPAFDIGWAWGKVFEIDVVAVFEGAGPGLWAPVDQADVEGLNDPNVTWAKFTEVVGPPPEPVTIGGTVTGLIGSGLVLQNNGADDLPIDSDGEFTFDTSLQPDLTYNVTVLTNPTNPTQVCNVENGSGDVPEQAVTDVAVTCVEPGLASVKKVAAEGDTLPDSTVLKDILLDGGVAINMMGQVAFGGRDDDGTDAAFTQAGKVVAERDTLEDGTILAAFRGQGEVAISAGQSGDRVAFHGMAETGSNDTAAVFTQAGQVAAVGDTLSVGITVDDIDPEGKVAINNYFFEVAFHGKVEIEGEPFNRPRAVFISDGMVTQVAAREASVLPDNTPLDDITESGGVAINDFAEVAFHGQSVFPDSGGDSLKAVFTSDGLVAKEGTDLLDGTILDDINEDGGVAINAVGEVAFHGQTVVPDTGGDSVKAVFISDGETTQVVAKVGETLPDGTLLEEIEVIGGVAINLFGDVAFHGRTDGVKAVFTQNGVVAKVGDNLDDGTTLSEISDNAGVAISPYGLEVAFHGRVDSTDAVFVGLAPSPSPSEDVVQVFVTSVPNNGNLGGLAGADQFCQDAADNAGLSGIWTAWLSDDNNDAIDRIPDGQYQLVGGTVIADDKEDLTDSELKAAINLDESGGGAGASSVWTGTQPNGTTVPPDPEFGESSNCSNWTSSEQETSCTAGGDDNCAARGNRSAMDATWTFIGSPGTSGALTGCSAMASLYCFGSSE